MTAPQLDKTLEELLQEVEIFGEGGLTHYGEIRELKSMTFHEDYVNFIKQAYNLGVTTTIERVEEFCGEEYDEQLVKETHDSSSAYAKVISFIRKLEKQCKKLQ